MTAGLETFAKVRALHDRTDSPGEKAAAMLKMQTLARKAGMSVEEAVSTLDAPAPEVAHYAEATANAFNDFFNTPFFRQARADSDRQRAEKWRVVLAEYGSEDAVFAPSPWEKALEQACEPFVVRKTTTGWPIGSLWGWSYVTSRGDPAPEIVDAIRGAYPIPTTVRQAWAEFMFWDKLGRDREARGVGCGDHPDWVYLRVQLLERLLDTHPAAGLADLRARISWMDWRNDLETAPDPAEERVRLSTLRADIERMGARFREHDAEDIPLGQKPRGFTAESQNPPVSTATVQNLQAEGGDRAAYPLRRTNADKRRDVMALLQSNAEESGIGPLSDREIARRAGVSPQTVGNIRRSTK